MSRTINNRVVESPELVQRARDIVQNYSMFISPHSKKGFRGRSVEFPEILVHAPDRASCLKKLEQVLTQVVLTVLKDGGTVPRPSDGRMTEQLNFKLTFDQKLLVENLASQRGFSGLSEFIRDLVIRESQIKK